MQIGDAAKATGVSAKMIRHYELIGLIPRPDRRASNYRDYDHADIHRLAFIRRARDLGFSTREIAALLKLWEDKRRSSVKVKSLAAAHLAELDAKIALLGEMRQALSSLIDTCGGNHRSDCPIIESLAGTFPTAH